MDIKLKYRAWVGEKHADISSPLTNSDIETFAVEFGEWLVDKNVDMNSIKTVILDLENTLTIMKLRASGNQDEIERLDYNIRLLKAWAGL